MATNNRPQIKWAASWENQCFAYAKTKTQISFAVTARLISAFVFPTWIVQYLYFLNTKFQSSSPSPVAVQPGLCKTLSESTLLVFSCCGSNHNRSTALEYLSHKARKPVFWVSNQVWHNPGCTATEDDNRLEISDLVKRGAALSM